jgi:hypothetical protein
MSMSISLRPTARAGLVARFLVAGVAYSAALGCVGPEIEPLVVATSRPPEARAALETELQHWWATPRAGAPSKPLHVEWLSLEPGDDLALLLRRRNRPDVLLAERSSLYQSLARTACLDAGAGPQDASLLLISQPDIVRRAPHPAPERAIHHADLARKVDAQEHAPAGVMDSPLITFNDPRFDPISLLWAESLLRESDFRAGYSRLIRAAVAARAIGRCSRSASGALARAEVEWAPCLAIELPARSWADRHVGPAPTATASGATRAIRSGFEATQRPAWVEAAAIVCGARHRDAAVTFLRFLRETQRMAPAQAADSQEAQSVSVSSARALLADLLGATLVDAHDELCASWRALEHAGFPQKPMEWMTEPPPWPPASISRLQAESDRNPAGLMETLAREIAPDRAVRAALVRLWLVAPRPIDLSLLADLAQSAEGHLCAEPRFRAWLKAEWTAWARQRYRRVARLASTPAVLARTASD